MSRLTSPWTPRMETRWPRRRSVRATWGTTGSYSFEFSSSLSRYVRTVIFTASFGVYSARSMPQRASETGSPPYASSSSWNRLRLERPRPARSR